jgi:5'-deoxynucleotidase YfbR-like HD superfamily hydrolase
MSRPDWLLDHTHPMPIEALAKAMSRINRFAGRTPKPYSVAKHAVVVMHLLPNDATPQAKMLALMHDAHEVYIGDVCRPLKEVIGHALKVISEEIDLILWDRYGLDPNYDDCKQVDIADNLANHIEVEMLSYSHTAKVEFALKQMDLLDGCNIPAVAKHLTYLTSDDRDTNGWLWWWNEAKCEAAKLKATS